MIELSESNIGSLPGLDLQFLIEKVGQFFFASLRVGSFILSSPLFGAPFVLLPVRIGIAMTITLLIVSLNPYIPTIENISSSSGVATAFTEIAIGLSAGLILTIIFASVSLAGEKIAAASGLSMAQQIDPTSGSSSPVVSQILNLFLIVVVFIVGFSSGISDIYYRTVLFSLLGLTHRILINYRIKNSEESY